MSSTFPDWLNALGEDLTHSGLTWAFRRDPDAIQTSLVNRDDLDLWCRRQHLAAAIQVLYRHGWIVQGGRAVRDGWTTGSSPMIRFTRPTLGSAPILELAAGPLRWSSFVGVSEDLVVADIVDRDGLPFIEGATRLSIGVTRVVLRAGFEEKRLSASRDEWERANLDDQLRWRETTSTLLGRRLTHRIEEWLDSSADPSGLYRPITLASALARKPEVILTFLDHVPELIRRLANPGDRRRGVLTAFLGTDGAGKTTTAELVAERLEVVGLKSKYVYFGRTRGNTRLIGGLRTRVVRLLRALPSPTPQEPAGTTIDATSPVRWRVAAFAGAPFYLLEYWFRYLVALRPLLRTGVNVLVDRGPDDIAVMSGPPRLMSLISMIGPPRHLTVFCDAPLEVIRSRKEERTLEALASQQAVYQAIVNRRAKRSRGATVRTVGPASTGVNAVVAAIAGISAVRSGDLDENLLPLFVQRFGDDPPVG